MAFDAANNSHSSRSHFQKSVSLQDWWLTKPQTDDGRPTIGVSGLTCSSQLSRVERCFSSAPIIKAYDFFELETVDGICVILQGYINKEKTLENGFSSEVFDHFVIGFPIYWEEYCTSCPKRKSSDECVPRADEDMKDSIEGHEHGNFDDINTTEDCKEIDFSNKASTTPHEECIMKPEDKVLFERPSEIEDERLKNNGLKFSGRRTTRSMTKMPTNKSLSNLNTKNLDESQIDTKDLLRKQNMKASKEKQESDSMSGSKSKRKLRFESSPNKVSMERYVNAKVVSPESLSGKRSRSGRVLLPSLEFWRNQTVVYDSGMERQVTGVRDVPQSSKDLNGLDIRLLHFFLGHGNREHSVFHGCFHLIHLSILRQPEPSGELPAAAFDSMPCIVFIFFLHISLATDLKDPVVFNLHLDFFFLDPRKIGLEHMGFWGFLPIHTGVCQRREGDEMGKSLKGSQTSSENGSKTLLRRPPKKLGMIDIFYCFCKVS
ncbi:hypothetical protein LXL04_000549 [Taraxacum kok-saghyz]